MATDAPRPNPGAPTPYKDNAMCDQQRLSFAPLANLRGPMPWRQKLRLVLSNSLLKARRRRNCCGNYDEPGC